MVLGSREPSCFISVTLELANSCFPKMSSRSNSVEDFVISSKQTNREFIAFKRTTSDSVFSLKVLHSFFQVRYFSFDILSHMLFLPLTLSFTCVISALFPCVSTFRMSCCTDTALSCWSQGWPVKSLHSQ